MRVSRGDGYVAINGCVQHMTKKAIHFSMDGTGDQHWIPMSVIFEDDLAEIDVGVIGEIHVKEWFYDKELA